MALVEWSTEGKLSRLTLRQPDRLNALGEKTAHEFARATMALAKEKSRVVILSGEGGAFSAGGDLDFIEANRKRPAANLPGIMRKFYASFLSIRQLPQITIAQINGTAVGAGLCLALACDLRTALSTAKLSLNFVRLGLNPGMAAWPLARAAFGESRAKELLATGRPFSGDELKLWGGAALSEDGPESLADATEGLAQVIASQSGESLRLLKEEMLLSDELDAYLRFEAQGQTRCFKGRDIAEGVAAIREKRPPRFA